MVANKEASAIILLNEISEPCAAIGAVVRCFKVFPEQILSGDNNEYRNDGPQCQADIIRKGKPCYNRSNG